MKQFALVGLFVALVTVRVEAQTSLFDVVVDLNAKTATITANSNVSPSILGANATTETLASELITTDGITFINLFGGGVSSILPSTATFGYEITLGLNSLSAYFPNEFTQNNVYSDLTKGVTLDKANSAVVNFETMKDMILNNKTIESEKRYQFRWDNRSKDIITTFISRSIKSTICEKRTVSGYDTLPFGVHEQ
jgi:hypothetical protein